MKVKTIALHALGATVISALLGPTLNAQVRGKSNVHASSATHVAAELTRGKLNPSESKPGDRVALKLMDDLRSNGQVVLKKGTTIDGVVKVVKSVKNIEGKGKGEGAGAGQAQSFMEIEWLVPMAQGRTARQVSIVVQSITHVSPIVRHGEADTVADFRPAAGTGSSRTIASGTSNVSLMSMPTVVAADSQTTSAMEGTFGMPSAGQLYKIGRGDVVSSGGTRHSIDIFSHMSNDTVITSQSKDFEVSSGAQLQLLVGVRK